MFKKAYDVHERVKVYFTRPTRTKGSLRDECDINLIMKRFAKTGVIDHLSKVQARYGDLTGFEDYRSSLDKVIAAQSAFDSLPAVVRQRFDNDPAIMIDFLGNESPDKVHVLLKELGLTKSVVEKVSKSEVVDGE